MRCFVVAPLGGAGKGGERSDWSSLARFLVSLKEYIMKQYGAEFLGTFWLVLGGCGSAVLAAKFGGDGNPLGIGLWGSRWPSA